MKLAHEWVTGVVVDGFAEGDAIAFWTPFDAIEHVMQNEYAAPAYVAFLEISSTGMEAVRAPKAIPFVFDDPLVEGSVTRIPDRYALAGVEPIAVLDSVN
ncbi:MAG: hypothetical protein AAFY15_04375 [Cyanobacteria bacterium J06648_11]